MPANRSRTLEWRRCLRQVFERNGALEIAVAHGPDSTGATGAEGQHLVWRVRLLSLSEREIVIEQPAALGQTIDIKPGIELIVMLAIGQNRWMFSTKNLGPLPFSLADRKVVPSLRLALPESVQRCQRRSHYRVETAALILPQVEVWPLLDPKSVLIAERAYEIRHEGVAQESSGANGDGKLDFEMVMPEVGPKFTATLVNLGGGGVGLRVNPQDGQNLTRHKLFWMRIALPLGMSAPICATGKLVHTHMESNHDTYAGMAFDFSFNPAHQRFVVDQICQYIALQQKSQGLDLSEEPRRRTA